MSATSPDPAVTSRIDIRRRSSSSSIRPPGDSRRQPAPNQVDDGLTKLAAQVPAYTSTRLVPGSQSMPLAMDSSSCETGPGA